MPPFSSQLKLKPNDALPVNTVSGKVSLAVGPGGRYPPPLPVHAVSSTARMPAAASEMNRRNSRGAPVFMVSPTPVRREGQRGGGKVHDVGDVPVVQGLCPKLRRTPEFLRLSVSEAIRPICGMATSRLTQLPRALPSTYKLDRRPA